MSRRGQPVGKGAAAAADRASGEGGRRTPVIPAGDQLPQFQRSASLAVIAFARAEIAFGSPQAAVEWLQAECAPLDFKRPVDLLGEDAGLAAVLEVLDRFEFGVYN